MTYGVDDEQAPPLAHVVVSAFSATAQAKLGFLQRLITGPALWFWRRRYGGLWIGGDAFLWRDRLAFAPNKLNAALHQGELSWSIPLRGITSVICTPAPVTDIIEIAHAAGVARIRCYGARAFAQRIEAAKSAAAN